MGSVETKEENNKILAQILLIWAQYLLPSGYCALFLEKMKKILIVGEKETK